MAVRLFWFVAIASSVLMLFAAISLPKAIAEDKDQVELSQYYGFKELELFKLQRRSANMLVGDLNSDGLNDLILIDNGHSRIDLLQQRRSTPKEKSDPATVNIIGSDWRFEHRKISVNKRITSMTTGDFNGDGRTDIAFFGVPDRLVVRYQPQVGDWTERVSFRLPDVQPVGWTTVAGDLNNDGKDDLVVLGKSETYVLHQQADGKLSLPDRLMNTSDKLSLAQITDLDGDGYNDLCYLAYDGANRTLCARLQRNDGDLGPELRFELNRPRSVTLFDIDGKPGDEILSIESETGRVKVHRLQRPVAKAGQLASRLIQFGFGRQGSGRNRDLATGDLDGDGLIDVVVTDPDAARMIVFKQKEGVALDLGRTCPGFDGSAQVCVDDLDGDKLAEVVILSTREKTLGLSRMRNGRLTFPQTLPVEHEPVALELADINADGRKEVVYISRKYVDRESKFTLRALKLESDGWKSQPFGNVPSVVLKLRSTPQRLVQLDVNNDKRPDFLIFLATGRSPHLLTTGDDGVPSEVDTKGGIQLGGVAAGAVFLGELDEPVILVAQKKFARNIQLGPSGQWQVVDQYNVVESNAKIVGAATINLDGRPGNEIVLIDSGVKRLRVLRRDGDLFQPWREVDTGSFTHKSTHVADLNNDGQDDLLLFGNSEFAVLYAGRTDPSLKEIASFESKLEKMFFADVVAGDLNGDGQTDLAVIDTRSQCVEVLKFFVGDESRSARLQHVLKFKVFEEKNFRKGDIGGTEPREAVVADVTHDGRDDLILLTHDRILLFPQDDGK